MAFTKITAAGIGSTETVTLDGLSVINNGSFGGNLTVGGVLTYEDVTNVDSVGLITARNGIVVGSGITLSKDGDGFFTGVITATSYSGIDLSDVTGATGDFSIADKIVHTGDTDTAIRFPAADTITAETNGSERARIDSSGRLLLGTTTSAAHANADDIVIAKAGKVGLTINSTDSDASHIYFADSSSNPGTYAGYFEFHHGTDTLKYGTGNDQRFQVDSSGRFMIGTTTEGQSSADDLTIATSGNTGITIRSGTSNTGNLYFSDGTSSTDEYQGYIEYDHSGNFLRFGTAASERVRIDSAGNIGVGGITPIAPGSTALHIGETSSNQPVRLHMTTNATGQTSSDGFTLSIDGSSSDVNLIQRESSNMIFYTSGSEKLRIASDGSVGFGLGSSYAPETPIDVVANWANTRSDVTTVSSYHRKLPLNERGDITLTARHSSSKDSAVGYVGPIIDFRSTNSSNEEWTVAQLVGGTDPLGGSGYQGGLSVFASNGGNNPNPAPSGRRDQGDAPTLSAVIAPYKITTFSSTGNQGSLAIHITKNLAANNVQSDMIGFDVGGSGRGKIVSASSGSSNPQFSSYSDRRLKTNFRNYTGGYDRIKAIPVKLYDEVLNDQTKSVFGDNVKTDVIGWIADEVQTVFPDAVMGTKDEVDSDGKPVYQSLTEGTFLPDAIQAIQKLIEKVETLEAEVAALKSS